MRLLFVVAHPKHIFIFQNTIKYFEKKYIPYMILAVDKDIVINLLNIFNFNYEVVGKNRAGFLNNFIEIPKRIFVGMKKARNFSPSLIIGQADPFFAIIGKLLSIPTLFLPDSEGAFLSRYIAFPLASNILVSNSYNRQIKQKHIRLNHYLEMAYLHPNYYSSTDDVYSLLKITPKQKYVIIRFVSWNAHHDIGHEGLTFENKKLAVKLFSNYANVFISSEGELPPELERYRINVKLDKLHQVLEKASLFFGESATMAAESAILGTPAIYIDNKGTGYTHDIEENYNLIFNFTESMVDQESAINKGLYFLKDDHEEELNKNRNKLIKDKIDISSYLINFIEQLHVSNN